MNPPLPDTEHKWWGRYDLIQSTARHLSSRRTGSEIQKALKSALSGGVRRGLLEYEAQRVRKI